MVTLRRGRLTFPRLREPLQSLKIKAGVNLNANKPNKIIVKSKGGKIVVGKGKREENKENSLKLSSEGTGLGNKAGNDTEAKPKNGIVLKKAPKKKLKSVSPKIDTRYFCPSCCIHVDASCRLHDLKVHKPFRNATFGQSPKKVKASFVTCDLCSKECWSEKSLELHKNRAHADEKKILKKSIQLPTVLKLKMKLECFQCNSMVPRKNYIDHLKGHDEEEKREDTLNVRSPVKGKPFRSLNSVREEYFTRRFVYQDPKDPRWNGEDAVLRCRHCPSLFFWTWDKFEKHVLKLHPYVPGSAIEEGN